MAKKVTAQVKLQIPAGKATPAPPVGTALGPQGVNIMDFCKAFNAKTSAKDQDGLIIPVVITIFSDRTFTFITKTPPAPVRINRAVSSLVSIASEWAFIRSSRAAISCLTSAMSALVAGVLLRSIGHL